MKTKYWKKTISFLAAVCLSGSLLAGCQSQKSADSTQTENSEKHLYLVIPLLTRKMRKPMSIRIIPMPAGPVSDMELGKRCFIIPMPWKLSHGWQPNMKIRMI